MTKRYTLAYEKGDWWAVKDGDITLWKEEVIATLNEQDKKINYLTELVKTYREYTIPELRIMRRMLKENGLYQQFLDRVDSEVILKNEKLRNILEPYLSRSGDME